jgi:hypothetical protein
MTTAIKTASELDLPEPAMRAARVGNEAWLFPKVGYYTADQMRDYGRQCAALAAGRAEPEKRADPRQTPLSRLVPIAFASVVDLESYVTMMTIGPHLPGVRDVAMYTKDQLHSAVNAAPSQPVGSARIQIDLTEEEGKAIADLVMAGDEPCEVTLCVGDGCEGHGLYAWQSEYPEEGASFIKTLAALTPEPAALPAEVEPPAYLNATGKDIWRIGFNTALSLAAPAQPAPEGDWLWIKLMDFCKARGFHPGQFNDLFAIVTEARKAQPAPEPAARCSLCNYKHGHCIGCPNNPVDLALAKKVNAAIEAHHDPKPAAQAAAVPEAVLDAARTALEAYDNRFESVTGRYNGPIDDEMKALHAAIESSDRRAG